MEQLVQCSRCGGHDDVDVRLAVCGASLKWTKNNFPAPNTTETAYNNITLWRLGLCPKCLPESYLIYLQKHMRRIAGQLGVCALLGLIALTWWFFGRSNRMAVDSLERLLIFAVVFAAFACVIGVPLCAVLLLLDFKRLRALQHSGEVPLRQVDKAFVGEGQRIIEVLSPSRSKPAEGHVFGNFPLPAQKTRDGKEMTLEEETRQPLDIPKRDIVAVSKSLEHLKDALPEPWKPLWVERKDLI